MIEWSWCNIVIMLTFLQYCAWKCSYCSIVCMNITLHILPEVKNWNYLVPQYQQLCLLSNSAAGVILCPFTLKRTSHILSPLSYPFPCSFLVIPFHHFLHIVTPALPTLPCSYPPLPHFPSLPCIYCRIVSSVSSLWVLLEMH